MTFVPGMELSARHRWRSVHLLAYLVDPDDAGLRAMTDRIRSSRLDRAQIMAERISHDYDIVWDDIVAQTTDGATVGRPHIADALVARGIVADRTEAFAGILHPAGDYYVALYAPDPVTAVELVVGSGGVPIVAHPAGRALLPDSVLAAMLDAGLAGFELAHRENLPEPTASWRASRSNATSSSRLQRLPRPGETQRAGGEHDGRRHGGAHPRARPGRGARLPLAAGADRDAMAARVIALTRGNRGAASSPAHGMDGTRAGV